MLVPIITLALVVLTINFSKIPMGRTGTSEGVKYHGEVCVDVIRASGEKIDLGCRHNVFTDLGKNITRDILGNRGVSQVDYIGLCNATAGCPAPAVTWTSLPNEYTSGGLARAQGTYGITQTSPGNWTISKTFTATIDNLETNVTGLFNGTATNALFAANSFTKVTLLANDQLTITWYIWVT
jgi:hypothetical protein